MRRSPWFAVGTIASLLALAGCGAKEEGGAGAAPSFRVPAGRPEDLPKVPPDAARIASMLRERFGDDVARNVRVEVEDPAGAPRVRLRGEVPTEEIRQALMREVAARVERLSVQDFDLQVSGPLRLVCSFPLRMTDSGGVAFTPDLSVAVTYDGDVFETATGRRLNRMPLATYPPIRSLAISPDGKVLATGHERSLILLWDLPLATNPRVVRPAGKETEYDATLGLAFSADGRSLAALNRRRGEVFVWDPAKGTAVLVGSHEPDPSAHGAGDRWRLAFAPDGRTIATANDSAETVALWDVAARKRVADLAPGRFVADALAWSHSGRWLVAARMGDTAPFDAVGWEMPGKRVRRFAGPDTGAASGVDVTRDDRTLAVRYGDRGVRFWDLATGAVWLDLEEARTGDGPGLAFSADGRLLAVPCPNLSTPSMLVFDVARRPGGPGGDSAVPPTLPVVARDDGLEEAILSALRGTFDPRAIESLEVEARPDGSVRLAGRVAHAEVKAVMGRTAASLKFRGDEIPGPPRTVVNDLEVTGRYGR